MEPVKKQQNMGNELNPLMMNQSQDNPMKIQANMEIPQMMMNPQLIMNQQIMMEQMNIQNMMNQLINQQPQNMAPNEFQPDNSNTINVNFRLLIGDRIPKKPITIQCNLNDKVSDIIQLYRKKAYDFDDRDELFIFNAKKLNQNWTCEESGIYNNCIIDVLDHRHANGGK